MPPVELSVVMPCLNEADTIGICLEILQSNSMTEVCRAEWGKLLFVGRKT